MISMEDSQDARDRAARALQLGRITETRNLLLSCLSSQTRDFDRATLHEEISRLFALHGQHEQRRHHLEQALALSPTHVQALTSFGGLHLEMGDLFNARLCLEQAIREEPNFSYALTQLAKLEHQCGHLARSNSLIDRAISIDPGLEPALELSFLLQHQRGSIELDSAAVSFLAQIAPSAMSAALRVIGAAYLSQNLKSIALQHYQAAMDIDPCHINTQALVASTLIELGRADEAIEMLLVASAMEPDHLLIQHELGHALQSLGAVDDAITIFSQILDVEPVSPSTANQLACCYKNQRKDLRALCVLESALLYCPSDPALEGNYATCLRSIGRYDDALVSLKRLLEVEPLHEVAFYNLMFTYSLLSTDFSQASIRDADVFWRNFRRRIHVDTPLAKVPSALPSFLGFANAQSRIKIGIVSVEIGGHVVSMFLKSFLSNYDSSRFHVTLILGRRRYEAREAELVALVDEILCVHQLDYACAVEEIVSRTFDILIDTSGYTASTQIALLAQRLAPVQCHYIGYHATTALDTIDYFIGDEIVTPCEFDPQFREKLIRLPRTWLAISYLESVPKALSTSCDERIVFGSFNQVSKFTDATLEFWAAVLNGIPNSVFLIKDHSFAEAEMAELIVNRLSAVGVSRDRLVFVAGHHSWQDHMSYYNQVDVCLDCTPWSGSTTAFDALSMGTPYLAIKGSCMAARMSSSIVAGFGQSSWIAASPAEYLRLAESVAADFMSLRARKAELQKQAFSSELHDGASLASALQSELVMALAAIRDQVRATSSESS
jgi:predicted O-linked N-acetylglucosamine transferase (SPINDLY family)